MQLKEVTFDKFEEEAAELGVSLPIEQTGVWSRYQETIPGRSRWGCFKIIDGEKTVAFISFSDFETHGYHYLRALHGPVWVEEPTRDQEADALKAIADTVRRRDHRQVFVRLSVKADDLGTQPTLSTVPYDHTVIIDVTGGDDAILARMKPRGRRDVRKALRESPVTCADETEQAGKSFEDYYDVMRETGERDGFVPAPISDYQDMITLLGPEHCRVFAGRDETGRVVTWSIVTISGSRAVRYYAGSRSETMRQHVTDKLVYFECCELGRLGMKDYDLMGIGSELAPSLMGLNEFKTKFTKEVAEVAPGRDLPLKTGFYDLLKKAHVVVQRRRDRKEEAAEQARRNAPREDLLPVVVGGDIGAYTIGRELHMAYHVKSICLASAPIGAIRYSRIFDVMHIEHIDGPDIIKAVTEIAQAHPDKKIFLTGNTDSTIYAINDAQGQLPDNVYAAVPSKEVVDQVSDKVQFQKLCQEVGIDVPVTEVVDLAGDDPIPATKVPFPLVAKPACSATYDHLYGQGFKKVYFVHEQAELDQLWKDLRGAGFDGEFLVQELIGGDDTQIGCLTVYVNQKGKPTMFASAQVLLEDHAPTMLGNPVAMISRPQPENWEKIERLLDTIDYKGFCNFDVKVDPKTGKTIFMDMNPRIGRGSFYVVAGGINPMRVAVSDVIDGKGGRVLKTDEKGLFTVIPVDLVKRYVNDELKAEIDELVKDGKVFDPQRYEADNGARRMLDVELTERNQYRKFERYYPEPTDTSF